MTANNPKIAVHRYKERPDDLRSAWLYTRRGGHVPMGHHGEALIRLSDYKALQAECEKLRQDAERYRWLRMAAWWDSPLCAVRNPAKQVKPGTDCPSRDRLDAAIDAAMQLTPVVKQ